MHCVQHGKGQLLETAVDQVAPDIVLALQPGVFIGHADHEFNISRHCQLGLAGQFADVLPQRATQRVVAQSQRTRIRE